MPRITVEFFGVAKLKAGRPSIDVEASDVGTVLLAVAERIPTFADACLREGKLRPEFLLSINGRQFTSRGETPLSDGDAVLIVSADAGG